MVTLTSDYLTLRMLGLLKPVIVAFNSSAAGIGVTARFSFAFSRIGIAPEAAASWFRPRVIGLSWALELTMTGRKIDADEAVAGGLARSVHPVAELMPAARSLAREVVANTAPVSVALIRQMMGRLAAEPTPMPAHRITSMAMQSRAVG